MPFFRKPEFWAAVVATIAAVGTVLTGEATLGAALAVAAAAWMPFFGVKVNTKIQNRKIGDAPDGKRGE